MTVKSREQCHQEVAGWLSRISLEEQQRVALEFDISVSNGRSLLEHFTERAFTNELQAEANINRARREADEIIRKSKLQDRFIAVCMLFAMENDILPADVQRFAVLELVDIRSPKRDLWPLSRRIISNELLCNQLLLRLKQNALDDIELYEEK